MVIDKLIPMFCCLSVLAVLGAVGYWAYHNRNKIKAAWEKIWPKGDQSNASD